MPGYTGGTTKDPSYEQVSGGNTGYVESIKIEYDPSVISFDDLLLVFFHTHDPTTRNRQGDDVGVQYQSSIFYLDNEQKKIAEDLIKELNVSKAYDKPVITDIRPFDVFYPAEDYHKDYYKNHPDQAYCQIVIAPKLEHLEKRFSALMVK